MRKLHAVLLGAAAAAVAGCASPSARDGADGDDGAGGLDLSSTEWVNGALEKSDIGTEPVGAHAAGANPALRAEDPWVGTVGWRNRLAHASEFGVGVLVPNTSTAREQTASQTELSRQAGVGVWLKFGF